MPGKPGPTSGSHPSNHSSWFVPRTPMKRSVELREGVFMVPKPMLDTIAWTMKLSPTVACVGADTIAPVMSGHCRKTAIITTSSS